MNLLSVMFTGSPADSVPAYIEKENQFATIKLTHSSQVEKLSTVTSTNSIYLSPNVSSISQFSFSYRILTISAKLTPKFLSGNDDYALEGKTSSRGFGLDMNFTHWQQSLSYHRTRGFFLENTKDYNPAWKEGMPYIQFPDLVHINFQGITAYNFNKRFSVNAVLTQSERQLKSAGSFIPLLVYRYYIIDDRSPMISSTQKSNSFEILAGAGYHYTFVWKDLYASLGLTPAFGYIFTKLTTRTSDDKSITHSNTPAIRIDARAGLGYNGPRFFAGVYMSAFSTSNRQQHTSVINKDDHAIVKAFVGYRFKAPGFLVKKMNVLDTLMKKKLPVR